MTSRFEGEHTPIRWLPKHGRPLRAIEWVSQTLVKIVAFLPIYVAIVVTIVLLLQIYLLSSFV